MKCGHANTSGRHLLLNTAQIILLHFTLPAMAAQLTLKFTYACSRDMVIAACDEAARKREARRGKPPRQFVVSAPVLPSDM